MVLRMETTVKWPDLAQLGSCGSSVDAAVGAVAASSASATKSNKTNHHGEIYVADGSGGTCDTSSTDPDPARDQQQQQQQQSPAGPGQQAQTASDMMYSSREVLKNVKQALAAAMEKKESSTTRDRAADQVMNQNHTDSSSSSAASAACRSPPEDSPLYHMWERAGNLLFVDVPQLQTSLEEVQQRWTAALFQNEACVSVVPCNSPARFARHYQQQRQAATQAPQESSTTSSSHAQPSPSPIQNQEGRNQNSPSPSVQQQQQEAQQQSSSSGLQQQPSSSHSSAASAGTRGKENNSTSFSMAKTVEALQSKAAAVAAAAAVAVALDEEEPVLVDHVKQQNKKNSNNRQQQQNNLHHCNAIEAVVATAPPSSAAASAKSIHIVNNNNTDNTRRNNVASSDSSTAQIEVSRDHQVRVIEPVHRPPSTPLHSSATTPTSTAIPPKSPTASSSSARKIVKRAPLSLLEVKTEDAAHLERNISELTMKSSYAGGESLARIPDNRRMAYYAVGKHHRQSGRGGNRRCYFSGKLILGGAPFYAGAVQQGLRTLVVFCLPSAIGLPDKETIAAHKQKQYLFPRGSGASGTPGATPHQSGSNRSLMSALSAVHQSGGSNRSLANVLREHSKGADTKSYGLEKRPSMVSRSKRKMSHGNNDGQSIASKSGMSRLSSLDDLSLSIDGDLDPNWGLDRDFLLKVLPEPDASILHQIAVLYPEQYETLPIQVRDAARWKIFVKFCFFSGLPIAEGEMHYKVYDEVAESVYGEEIVLSHDVMEAVNGDVSAELLQLPNQKAFRYLRKHYAQQCNKLDDRVFRRAAWERVAPEV